MIIGIICVCDAFLLFIISGVNYSYLFVKFVVGLNLACDVLDYLVYVSTLVGKTMVVTHVYHAYFVLFVIF